LPRHAVLEDVEAPPTAAPPVAPPKDDQECDLDPETIARIDAAAAASEGRTHYAILGVPPAAAAKEVSRAYFALAATLHPDRYFGKRLGPYKKKLEQAFRMASDAYEVLRSASRRAEYDGYLGLRRKSVEIEIALAPPAAPIVTIAPIAPVAAPAQPVAASVKPPAPSPVAASVKPPAPSPVALSVKPPAPSPVAASVKSAPPTPAPRLLQTIITSEPPAQNSRLHKSVRRLVADAKSATLLQDAQKALVDGDAIAAANLYRLALQYAEDPSARGYAQSGLNEARAMVADTYLKRALYEEKEARWTEAVASYEKALDRRPDDPAICERLANALRQEGQDLLRATRLAELAAARTPRNSACRRTLGLIYADAGLREKALEQFEKAAELEPSDEVTKRALTALRSRSR
jgi:Flp pilus assembly protein TadD